MSSPPDESPAGHGRDAPNMGPMPDLTPLAQASLARDLEIAPDADNDDGDDKDDEDDQNEAGKDCTSDENYGEALPSPASDASGETPALRQTVSAPGAANAHHLLGTLHVQPGFTGAGNRATIFPNLCHQSSRALRVERQQGWEQERSLLRDNNIIPPKHPQQGPRRRLSLIESSFPRPRFIPGGDKKVVSDEEAAVHQANDGYPPVFPTEASPLLGDPSQPYGGRDNASIIDSTWEAAVEAGKIQTTWQRESKVLVKYSAPLMLTFVLQYSLVVASVFTVGHIGVAELGAVSLASMTANITGYAIYQGLATSLDTLCAQAYGSGHKRLVGLQMQRMVYFLWLISIPIAVLWLLAERILAKVVPEREIAALAGLYLRIVLLGAPGYATFEAGKRYVQAQGLFSAALYVLLICSPLNALMNWLFVWKFQMGFVGAPIAVTITENLLPVGLFLYVRFISQSGMSCWGGFTRAALQNWMPMIKLALPGFLMVEAEVLAFEILTLAASYLGPKSLAAQSVVATICSLTFQIPFPLSVATSTRVANLIGATLAPAAKTAATVAGWAAVLVGLFNLTLLSSLRGLIPYLFTSDPDVVRIVAHLLPLCAAFQLGDALASICNGILRGLGRQEFGGWVQVFCYYAVAMPISLTSAFSLDWGLWGLWFGVSLALDLVAVIEGIFLARTNWQNSVEMARKRNAAG